MVAASCVFETYELLPRDGSPERLESTQLMGEYVIMHTQTVPIHRRPPVRTDRLAVSSGLEPIEPQSSQPSSGMQSSTP
jgi:hypothetical protein